ncbi:hypothetical protein HN680_01490 [Candidatus Peregrinibacteria bacterium]|nr:hypothetical protein [Candidatus Peregrinibacteria bacterium]
MCQFYRDFIIKSYQGEDERIIAPLVGESGFGPQQFPSLRNVMTEEFVPGQPLLDIQPGKPRKYYHDLGRRLGQFYRALHERNIFYNDGLINYEFGKSHVILGEEPEQAKVIDFGLSLNVSDPSAFTDEQVFNFARTLPGNSFLLGLRVMEPRGLVDQERDRVKSLTSPDIIKRDLEMLGESMDTLRKNQGRDFVRFIWQGFEKAYEI